MDEFAEANKPFDQCYAEAKRRFHTDRPTVDQTTEVFLEKYQDILDEANFYHEDLYESN
jgi:hypothetical protein